MNTTTILAVRGLSLVGLLLAPTLAAAGPSDGLGTYEGSGTVQAVDGSAQGRFNVAVVRKTVGAKTRTDGKATLASGEVITFWQETEEQGAGAFHITSSNGSGNGRCFTNGMCQSYEERADGHAFATTLVKDSPARIRILVTELSNGRAVRFIEQSLTKK